MGIYSIIVVSIVISVILDLILMRHTVRKEPIANILFGLQTTLVGIFIFYVVYNTTFYSPYGNVIPFFMATFMITTGFMFSLFEFLKK